MPVIYIDVLLAVNLLIDFLLLSATAYLLHVPAKRWRTVVGAVCGALCSCIIFLPPLPLMATVGIKLAAAAGIIRISFPWRGAASYFKQMIVFFVVSTVFAGVAFGLWVAFVPQGMAVINGVVYYDVPPLLLVFFSVVSYGLLRLYDRYMRKKAPRQGIYRLKIDGGAGMTEVNALYDTGHHITEQFSGSPVVIVHYDALKSSLPANLQQSLLLMMDGKSDELSSHAALKSRMRLIPFHSMGGAGLLPAFRPVGMWLSDGAGHTVDIGGAYVAVSRRLKSREYQALIGSDLTDMLNTKQGGTSHEYSCTAG